MRVARLCKLRPAGSANEAQEGDHDTSDGDPYPDDPLDQPQFECCKTGVQHIGRHVAALLRGLTNSGRNGISLGRCELGISQVTGDGVRVEHRALNVV